MDKKERTYTVRQGCHEEEMRRDEIFCWVLWDCIGDVGLKYGTTNITGAPEQFTNNPDEMEGYHCSEQVISIIDKNLGHHPGDRFYPLRKETAKRILEDVAIVEATRK
jgi:hypothetical protein